MIQLAIVDGSRIFADALASRLGTEPDIRVVRCATGAAALRQAVDNSSADVVLGDAALFDPSDGAVTPHRGLALASDAGLFPRPSGCPAEPALVLLADYDDRSRLAEAIRWGVRGWVPRDATLTDLLAAIRAAAAGGTWIPPEVLTGLLGELTMTRTLDDPNQTLLAALTPREQDVLSCLADGLGRAEVAATLNVSTNTVRTHVQSILSKLNVNSCVAAVALARKASTGGPALRLLTRG